MGAEYPKDVEAISLYAQSDFLSERPTIKSESKTRFSYPHIVCSFLLGILVQFAVSKYSTTSPTSALTSTRPEYTGFVPPYVGSTEVHPYPPTKPTNTDPSLFPSNIGFAGPTPTGAEPALLATAPANPIHSGAPGLLSPSKLTTDKTGKPFDFFRHLGNLSPWYTNERGAFGVESGPEAPDGCSITGLHLLHRHGARYPTGSDSYGTPGHLAARLQNASEIWSAEGELEFLNDWTYKLGEEILTPFGRHQLFDLGVSTRMKYGFLLKNFTESNTIPLFRTESQDRMLASAMNFVIGFFGYPFDGMYQNSITVEAPGCNNTLTPHHSCPNANDNTKGHRQEWFVRKWSALYLKDARSRLNSQLRGLELSIEDVYTMQHMCAYETVALGYSKFCELFTVEEWEAFDHAIDLYYWYGSAFGSPVARAQGVGYIQELVARLTQTPIETHNSSTNATLDDNPITFPLDGRSLYVDATHEVVILNVLTALNLTTLASAGPLSHTGIPDQKSFVTSRLAPFASNIQFQLLSCASTATPDQIRIIVNDGVVPLHSITGCPSDPSSGMCPVEAFVDGMREVIRGADWEWGCYGEWEVPEGDEWETVSGSPPTRDEWEEMKGRMA